MNNFYSNKKCRTLIYIEHFIVLVPLNWLDFGGISCGHYSYNGQSLFLNGLNCSTPKLMNQLFQ